MFIPLIKPIPDEIPDENEAAAVFSRPGAGQASCHNSSYRPDTKEAHFKKSTPHQHLSAITVITLALLALLSKAAVLQFIHHHQPSPKGDKYAQSN